jgi:hypothetical protein
MVELDYKQQLKTKRDSIIPPVQVILNSVFSQPKSIFEIKSALATHGHSRNFSHKRLKTLFDRLDIVGIPTLCSPDKPGNKTSQTWRYGLRDKIMNDLEGAPDACDYINRTSWYLRETLNDCFYRCLSEEE